MTSNPSQTPLPILNTPFLDAHGFLTFPWYAFLSSLHTKSGGSLPASDSVALQFANGAITAFAADGAEIGPVAFTGTTKQAAELLDPVVSPFIYTASENGFLIVSAGAGIQFSRDHLTFYPISTNGGQIVMLTGDQVQVTWSGGPPSVVWFGGNT
jgi:hypothetical protein